MSAAQPAARLSQGAYVHDESLWPVAVTMIPSRALDEELVAHMRHVDALYARGEPFLTVTFIDIGTRTTSRQRQLLSSWMKETREQMVELNKGAVFITGSKVFRFVLAGVMLLGPLPIPYETFAAASDAVPWLRDKAHEHELSVPFDLGTGLAAMERRYRGL